MSDRALLLEILRVLAAAGLIDGNVFVRCDGVDAHAHALAVDLAEPRRRRHLVGL